MTIDLRSPNESLDPDENTVALVMKKLGVKWEPDSNSRWLAMGTHYLKCNQDGTGTGYGGETGRRYPCLGAATGPYLIINNPYRYKTVDAWRIPFLAWLANESPFSGIFLTKNPEGIDKFGAILDWDTHTGLAFGAGIAMRTLHEHANHGVIWWQLVKRGVDPTFAYMVAMCWKVQDLTENDDKEDFLSKNKVIFTCVNHGGVDPFRWNKTACIRWLTGKNLLDTKEKKAADGTFTDGNYPDLQTLDPIPRHLYEETKDRWGNVSRSLKTIVLVEWWAENWVAFSKKTFNLDYAETGFKPTFKIETPLLEPETDV